MATWKRVAIVLWIKEPHKYLCQQETDFPLATLNRYDGKADFLCFAFNPNKDWLPLFVSYRKDSHRLFMPANGYIALRFKLFVWQCFSRDG